MVEGGGWVGWVVGLVGGGGGGGGVGAAVAEPEDVPVGAVGGAVGWVVGGNGGGQDGEVGARDGGGWRRGGWLVLGEGWVKAWAARANCWSCEGRLMSQSASSSRDEGCLGVCLEDSVRRVNSDNRGHV